MFFVQCVYLHNLINPNEQHENIDRTFDIPKNQIHTPRQSSSLLPKTQAHRCNITGNITSKFSFNSQRHEDEFLLNQFFRDICGGTYIEMGALDGIRYSNSLFFNQALDWKGLLIEADPNNYKKLVDNRKNELVTPIHAAVCDKKQDVHWVSRAWGGPTAGILEFAPKHFQEIWWDEKMISRAPVIKCLPLNDIVHNASVERDGRAFFDFFSLDVEGAFSQSCFLGKLILMDTQHQSLTTKLLFKGGEFDVLKSIDFSVLSFGVILFESDDHNPLKNIATRLFLQSKGTLNIIHKLPPFHRNHTCRLKHNPNRRLSIYDTRIWIGLAY